MSYVDDIIGVCLSEFGVTMATMLEFCRKTNLVNCRTAISYLLHKHTSLSYPEIAVRIGRREHSTIYGAAKRWPKLDEEVRKRLQSKINLLMAKYDITLVQGKPPRIASTMSRNGIMWAYIRELREQHERIFLENDALRIAIAELKQQRRTA